MIDPIMNRANSSAIRICRSVAQTSHMYHLSDILFSPRESRCVGLLPQVSETYREENAWMPLQPSPSILALGDWRLVCEQLCSHYAPPGLPDVREWRPSLNGQEADAKAALARYEESKYLYPETQEYKRFRAKIDARREGAAQQPESPEASARRPVTMEQRVETRRLRLENRRKRDGRLPDRSAFD